MINRKTPYEVLGVPPSASQEDIKNAYRNLAKKFHPDINPGKKDTETKFKEINAANALIGNPTDRAKFDRGEMDDNQESSARAAAYARTDPSY